jgi:hypothetical protein
VDAIRGLHSPDVPALSRWGDVSFGWQHKKTSIALVPGEPEAVAENDDWGVTGRIAPFPGQPSGRSALLELSFGYADLNNDETSHFVFPTLGDAGPSTRIQRTGFAARTMLPFGGAQDGESSPWAWWLATVPSAVEIGVAYDRELRTRVGSSSAEVDHWGLEVSLMEILTGRVGHVDDPTNDIHGVSGGLGVHVPIGSWGSVGYDWASDPTPEGLKSLNRHGFSAWLHPTAIWSSWRNAK